MRITTSTGPLIAALAALLTACSAGAGPQTPIPHLTNIPSQSFGISASAAQYAYISDVYGNFVDKFDLSSGALLTKMTGLPGPGVLYVDSKHDLWVGLSYGNGVVMYPPRSTTPARHLVDGGSPAGIAMGRDGTVYVSNALDANGSNGSILVYPPGRNTPARKLQDPRMFENYFITIDNNDNIFVTTNVDKFTEFVGRVDEYVGAKQSGLVRWPVKLYSPGGIKWVNGYIYVCDNGEYTVTQYTESGMPTGRKMVTGGAWAQIDITPDGKSILGADQTFIQGIVRGFPFGRIQATFKDSALGSPVGAALDVNEKAF